MAGVMATTVGTIVVQPVAVIAVALAAAVGWGTARAGLEKVVEQLVVVVTTAAGENAGHVEILPDNGQHKHATELAELVVTDVVTVEAVGGDDLDTADDETGLGTSLKRPKGLIMLPSWSILVV